jgi:hypothetical protein
MPNFSELLPPQISAGQRKLHAGKDVAVRRDVAGCMTGAARETVHDIFAGRGRRGAEFFHVTYQFLVAENLLELGAGNS